MPCVLYKMCRLYFAQCKVCILKGVQCSKSGGSANVFLFFIFLNIIIKCNNFDKGRGGGATKFIPAFFQ